MSENIKAYDRIKDESDRILWRSGIRREISKGIVEVVFEKKDSSIRILRGTTDIPKIPSEHIPEKGKERKYDENKLCTIFDLEAQGWRSFNYDSVISVRTGLDETEVKNATSVFN